MEVVVFLIAATVCLAGGVGVIASPNPVHSALSLVATLFGIAVLFVAQEAHFLAAVQVIVYAGAIVVLFLFVIMLLGVDRAEDLEHDSLAGQRPAAAVVAVLGLLLVVLLAVRGIEVSGARSGTEALSDDAPDVVQLGRVLFTDYVFAFELTGLLLVIAVIGAVVMARKPRPEDIEAVVHDTATEAAEVER
jgi:NADH-quinone oxidoreductase subunit J